MIFVVGVVVVLLLLLCPTFDCLCHIPPFVMQLVRELQKFVNIANKLVEGKQCIECQKKRVE